MNMHSVTTVGVDLTPLEFKLQDLPRLCLRMPDSSLGCATKLIKQHTMETIGEIIPFAKEMLHQRPTRGMLKLYVLGSTLAMLGVVGAMVETVLMPFVEQESVEDAPAELIMEKKKKKEEKQELKSHTTVICPDVVNVLEMVAIEAKAKHLVTAVQRSSTRLHAS